MDTPSPEKISDTVDWVSVTGKIIYLLYLQDDIYYAYALRSGGQLYSLSYNNTYETVDVARVTISGQAIDGFTCVKGVSILSEDKAECCLAISDGKLYAVLGSYANQVGSVTGWTSVSDCDSNYGFGICDGKLYQIMTTGTPTGGIVGVDTNPSGMAMQVGSRTGWTKISGRKSTSEYPIGICDGKLYRIAVNDVTQIGTESEWTHIGGYCSETGTTGYGICGGKLYAIGYNSVTQIGTEDDWMYLSESGTIAIRGSDGTGGGGEEPGGGGDIPTDGLVFYAPLAESKATAETGQTLNVTGSRLLMLLEAFLTILLTESLAHILMENHI